MIIVIIVGIFIPKKNIAIKSLKFGMRNPIFQIHNREDNEKYTSAGKHKISSNLIACKRKINKAF